jgi:hypothetical protein
VWNMKPSIYGLILLPPVVAFTWSALMGHFVLRLEKPTCVAIAIEATIQNAPVAIGVLQLSIRDQSLKAQAFGVPLAYSTVTLLESILM